MQNGAAAGWDTRILVKSETPYVVSYEQYVKEHARVRNHFSSCRWQS
jgi:hypothetical protein